MRPITLTLLPVWLTLVSCSTIPVAPDSERGEITAEASACLDDLSKTANVSPHRLNHDGFSVVNWNIQKGKHKHWADDLQRLNAGVDLLILQEAPQKNDAWDDVAPGHYRSFAEGFGFKKSLTGVLTLSSAPPLGECQFVAFEPWFNTRKATLVTEYALTDTVETLLVVNVHSINFSIGVEHMHKQLLPAVTVMEHHDGPVLLSGDFNTWRGRRAEVVEAIVEHLGLAPLEYEADHRKRRFGHPLDHIYVRGLRTLHATSMELDSSDHNPMAVRFSYGQSSHSVSAAP